MKFLKSFKENVDCIISEIETISHILEDEGLIVDIHKNIPHIIVILISGQILPEIQNEEFEDRLKEICEENSYLPKKLRSARFGSNKTTWHLFDKRYIGKKWEILHKSDLYYN